MRPRYRLSDDGTALAPILDRKLLPFDTSGELGDAGSEWAKILLSGITIPDDLAQTAAADKICQFRNDARYPAGDGSLITAVTNTQVAFIGRAASSSTHDLTGGTLSVVPSGSVAYGANANRIGLIVSATARFGQLGDGGFGGPQEFTLDVEVDGTGLQAGGYGRFLEMVYAGPSGGQCEVSQAITFFVAGETAGGSVTWGNFSRSTNQETGRCSDRTLTVWEITT